METRRPQFRIPGDLAIVMRVHIDKPRSHQIAIRIDLEFTWRGNLTDRDKCLPIDSDIGVNRRSPRTIDNFSSANYQIVHACPLSE